MRASQEMDVYSETWRTSIHSYLPKSEFFSFFFRPNEVRVITSSMDFVTLQIYSLDQMIKHVTLLPMRDELA